MIEDWDRHSSNADHGERDCDFDDWLALSCFDDKFDVHNNYCVTVELVGGLILMCGRAEP